MKKLVTCLCLSLIVLGTVVTAAEYSIGHITELRELTLAYYSPFMNNVIATWQNMNHWIGEMSNRLLDYVGSWNETNNVLSQVSSTLTGRLGDFVATWQNTNTMLGNVSDTFSLRFGDFADNWYQTNKEFGNIRDSLDEGVIQMAKAINTFDERSTQMIEAMQMGIANMTLVAHEGLQTATNISNILVVLSFIGFLTYVLTPFIHPREKLSFTETLDRLHGLSYFTLVASLALNISIKSNAMKHALGHGITIIRWSIGMTMILFSLVSIPHLVWFCYCMSIKPEYEDIDNDMNDDRRRSAKKWLIIFNIVKYCASFGFLIGGIVILITL